MFIAASATSNERRSRSTSRQARSRLRHASTRRTVSRSTIGSGGTRRQLRRPSASLAHGRPLLEAPARRDVSKPDRPRATRTRSRRRLRPRHTGPRHFPTKRYSNTRDPKARAVVTENVRDFRPLAEALLAADNNHAGVIFTDREAMAAQRPRSAHRGTRAASGVGARPAEGCRAPVVSRTRRVEFPDRLLVPEPGWLSGFVRSGRGFRPNARGEYTAIIPLRPFEFPSGHRACRRGGDDVAPVRRVAPSGRTSPGSSRCVVRVLRRRGGLHRRRRASRRPQLRAARAPSRHVRGHRRRIDRCDIRGADRLRG